MSFGGFFRSLSAKVSQSLEEIKTKSSEAGQDIARGMREIRDSTKASVEKIGVALQISESDTPLYEGVDETAGMALAMHYSQALGTIKSNNRLLIEKGDRAALELHRVHEKTSVQQESITALIKQCSSLPELCNSINDINARCQQVMERLTAAEALLGDYWEDTVISQISVTKKEHEDELAIYEKKKLQELDKLEAELSKTRESRMAEKRTKAAAKAAEIENAAAAADTALQQELDASIKKGMDEYLIYGFSAKPVAPTQPEDLSQAASASAAALAAVVLPSTDNPELDDFLGDDEAPTQPAKHTEDDDEGPAIKVDDTIIEEPEP